MAFLFSSPQPQVKQQPALSGIQVQTSVYGKCIPIVYGTNRIAPNLLWYGDFTAIAHKQKSQGGKGGVTGGGGGKGGGGSTTYTYKTSFAMALSEGPIQGVNTVYLDKNTDTLSSQGFSLFTGTYPQTAWSYLTTNHPDQALGYNGISYVAASAKSLGNSANIPNYNFEVQGIYSTGLNGSADPSLVIPDFLSNAKYGAGFPSARIGDLTTFQNYCYATGLFISPAYTTQQQASSMIDDICKNTNSAAVWSSGKLNIVPYGDTNLTGNGKTYIAPSVPLYDLGDDDYVMANAGDDPVLLNRKRQSDSINSLKMEYQDASNNYNTAVVEVKDQVSIELYGFRQDASNNSHLFTNGTAAKLSANLQLYRQQIRNTYTFTTDIRYLVLDPMDIVTLTDSRLGLSKQWVRITEINENDDYTLTFTAEEYLQGTGTSAAYAFQNGSGYAANYNAAPGNVNTPVIFEPPVQLATNTGLEIWAALSGGSNWGGSDVYVSSDNTNYQYVGTQHGPARQGVLTSILPMGNDPDTVNTLTVNLTQSNGDLSSGTQNDADLGHTICYVDGELVSYETATLTASNTYSLTYLRRGQYGTSNADHANGSQFARLDNQIFTFPYDKTQIGTTIYLKFCSFNIYGGGQQSLADVSPVTYNIVGPPRPADVQNFSAKQAGDAVAFTWDQVANDFLVTDYDIGYAAQGTSDWSQFQLLSEREKGTEMTNASVPFGDWTFGIVAKDLAGNISANPNYVNLTVVNTGNSIAIQDSAPDWVGTNSGFVKHYTGFIAPKGQFSVSHYSSFQWVQNFVPDPVSSGVFTAQTINIGYTDNVRAFATITGANGQGTTGAPTTQTLLDYWTSSSSDPGTYTPWGTQFATLQYASMQFTVTGISSANANYYTQFEVELDKAQNTTQAGTQAVSSLGTAISFPMAFHSAPVVTGIAQVSSAPLTVTASPVSSTGCTLWAWSSATAVAATVMWNATGE